MEERFTAMPKRPGLFLLDMMDVPDGSNDNQVGNNTEDGEAHVQHNHQTALCDMLRWYWVTWAALAIRKKGDK